MVPEYWLTEGGQSATGALLDHIIESHVASPHLANQAASRSKTPFQFVILYYFVSFVLLYWDAFEVHELLVIFNLQVFQFLTC